ncbi:MAG: tetratricopeptide repeat protein [Humidesulfovibrio sp.]|nr:tetratricopeptide repeat protein [Humidesulfovibrio sp.]
MNGRPRLAVLLAGLLVAALCAGCALPKIAIYDDPLTAEEHLKLGMAYEAGKEPERAAEEYRHAARKLPLAHLYLGNTYFGLERYADAEDEYRAAVRLLPGNAEALNNLAWLLYTREKPLEEAESLAARAVRLEPDRRAFQDTLAAIRARRASIGSGR